jgi:hypothetical protein
MSEPTGRSTDANATSDAVVTPGTDDSSASKWEDFIDIFYAPSAVFARRAASGFFIPMVVVTLLTAGLYLLNSNVWSQVMDAELTRALAKRAQTLTPEQMERARGISQTMAKVAAFVFMPVGMFFTGLALWLCGKLVDAKQTLAQALMVTSYAFIPRVVEGVVTSVQGLLLDPSTFTGRWRISLGLGRFLDPDAAPPVLLALLGRIDVFTIWVTVLLAIGLSVTGKIPRARAAVAAVIVWVLGAVPLLLQSAR